MLLFGKGTKITDLPEHRRQAGQFTHDGLLLDEVVGLGPEVTNADLTSIDKDLKPAGNSGWMPGRTLIHEFAHVVHLSLSWKIDRSFVRKVNEAYSEAMRKRRWKNNYAATNSKEYFAVGAGLYFDNFGTRGSRLDGLPYDRNSLMTYDRKLYDLIDSIYRSRWNGQFSPPGMIPAAARFRS